MTASNAPQSIEIPREIEEATPADPHQTVETLRRELSQSLLGKEPVIEHVLACVLARGHLLLEDLPGLGKTTLAKSLATAIGGRFSRIQCTPDLLPSDVTGFKIFDQSAGRFEFIEGPVFADVVLADEINRTTPRTQSALLEAMAERQVTIDNTRHVLSETFFVIATQNPIDEHGTYGLPEAQLDRFAMKLSIGYAAQDHEIAMLARDIGHCDLQSSPIHRVVEPRQLHAIQHIIQRLEVSRTVQRYLVELAHASRQHPSVRLGVSPRGLLTWQRLSQARAFLSSRDFVTPDDVQAVAKPMLSVRLGVTGESVDAIVDEIVNAVPVPTKPE
jgi:MoxR-like ATPase